MQRQNILEKKKNLLKMDADSSEYHRSKPAKEVVAPVSANWIPCRPSGLGTSSLPLISKDSPLTFPSMEEPVSASPPFASWEQSGRRRRQRLRRIATLLLSCVTVSVLVAAFTLLLTRSRLAHSVAEPCRSPSCRRFMDLLEASIDTTLDPCQDFYAFVCSRWKPDAGGRTFLEDSVLAFQDVITERAAAVKVSKTNQNRFQKAVTLFQSCLAKEGSAVVSFRAFIDVVMGAPWPDVNTNMDPLGIILDLSFQWRCPVLFYAFFTQVASSVRKLVFMDSSAGMDFPALFAEYRSRQDHDRYICELHAALNKGLVQADGDRDSPIRTKWCKDLARFQHETFSEIVAHAHGSQGRSYGSVYEFAAQTTPGVSGERWMSVIGAHARRSETPMGEVTVEVKKPAYLKAIARILEDNSRKKLLTLIGLIIVQVIGRFASGDLAALIFNLASAAGRKRQRTFCYKLADISLPGALGNAYLFEDKRVSKAKEIAEAVVASTIAKLQSSSWLTTQSREKGVKKIGQASLAFEGLLREAAATNENFSVTSTYFLENAKNFPNDIWLHFKERYSNKASTDNGGWLEHPRLEVDSSETALRFVIPDVYMSELVFPEAAYESINYGTVGSLIARRAASTLDPTDLSFDGGGHHLDWLTPEERTVQNGTFDCLVREFEHLPECHEINAEGERKVRTLCRLGKLRTALRCTSFQSWNAQVSPRFQAVFS
ncbi:hypothetical protein HPB50_001067 [Hyalomma asiaticum]|uniref:Uncharacterized protein n=1 Tax=Hyalomma asiaticum TaxID=266040 RepID=A0ACB7RLA6_HYAAI|nr:hypothetical protein HPB50_001067 [Hyalomma asiaticum]